MTVQSPQYVPQLVVSSCVCAACSLSVSAGWDTSSGATGSISTGCVLDCGISACARASPVERFCLEAETVGSMTASTANPNTRIGNNHRALSTRLIFLIQSHPSNPHFNLPRYITYHSSRTYCFTYGCPSAAGGVVLPMTPATAIIVRMKGSIPMNW